MLIVYSAVLLWLTSVQPLVLAVEGMSSAKQIQWQVAMYATAREVELQLDNTQFVLGVSMTVFLFCIHGLRVLWPKGFEGEVSLHDTYCRIIDVDCGRHWAVCFPRL